MSNFAEISFFLLCWSSIEMSVEYVESPAIDLSLSDHELELEFTRLVMMHNPLDQETVALNIIDRLMEAKRYCPVYRICEMVFHGDIPIAFNGCGIGEWVDRSEFAITEHNFRTT